jgi:hypothetical protein
MSFLTTSTGVFYSCLNFYVINDCGSAGRGPLNLLDIKKSPSPTLCYTRFILLSINNQFPIAENIFRR